MAIYRADLNEHGVTKWAAKWTPSIHMPRWACRLVLEVTGVRVERLCEISEADCLAEGIGPRQPALGTPAHPTYDCGTMAHLMFRELWGSVYGPGSWAANPWVWVVEFRRLP